MRVYVCYRDYGRYEGASPPEAAFLDEKLALDYCAKHISIDYVELEMDETTIGSDTGA